MNPANQPVDGTLGRVETALCDACLTLLAPAVPPALAAAESTGGAVDVSAAAGLLRWLGASGSQAAAARVRLVADPPTEGADPQ